MNHILAEVVRLLSLPGAPAQVRHWEKLGGRPAFWVSRVQLEGGALDQVVVKHVAPDRWDGDRIPIELREEFYAYAFLEQLGFPHIPAVVGRAPGLIVLEDVAEVTGPLEGLAEVMADLHRQSHLQVDAWRLGRARAGLPIPPEPACPLPEEWTGMSQGLAYVRGFADARNAGGLDWEDLDGRIRAVLRVPGPFRGLVHQELSSTRNIRNSARGPVLIDLERLREGHTLLDLCAPCIGRLEWNHRVKGTFLRHQGFGPPFVSAYQAHWFDRGGQATPEVWREHLAMVQCYCAFFAIGHAMLLERRLPALQPLASVRQESLHRLKIHLEAVGGQGALVELLTRIEGPS